MMARIAWIAAPLALLALAGMLRFAQ